ncbi:MAG TPA: hypothetical protein VF094_07635 [Gaiellaceae bacterium]
MIREELSRLLSYEERHRRLFARLLLVLIATAVIDAVGSVLIWLLERHAAGTAVHSFGDALFFTTVQLLTVSSQLRNPLTASGRVVDVALEVWAVIVVAGSAGAIASFFQSADGRGA